MSSRPDRKAQRLDDKLAARLFENEDVRSVLDDMDVDTVIRTIGEPRRATEYAVQPGWAVGSGRPTFADDDPAVMQAIGRCAANRVRHGLMALAGLGGVHPSPCGWCDYPLEQLLEACSWAVLVSRYVVLDLLIWRNDDGAQYSRPGGLTGYQNPSWRQFFEVAPKERERRIEAAAERRAAA